MTTYYRLIFQKNVFLAVQLCLKRRVNITHTGELSVLRRNQIKNLNITSALCSADLAINLQYKNMESNKAQICFLLDAAKINSCCIRRYLNP